LWNLGRRVSVAADISFSRSEEGTVGVEFEVQLLDEESLAFKDISPQVLKALFPRFGTRIKEEFIKSMIELNTRVCADVREAEADLRESLGALEEELRAHGAVMYSASLHPLEKGTGRNLTDSPRYGRILEDLQIVGRRFITQGLHVHIGVGNADRAIRINNHMRMYLPLLLALSTSSPFYSGEVTGLFSYRTKLFEALPMAGLPDMIESWEEFKSMAELLISGGVIAGVKDLWWDVRPHPGFGTVEVRVCDLPCRFSETMALVALIQALVVTLGSTAVHPAARIQMQILKANKWQAARYGLDGVFVNPVSATRQPVREAVAEMLDFVRPAVERLGTLGYLSALEEVLESGTGAHRQLELYRKTGGDFKAVISGMRAGFDS
jgi:carboxylate-amine ligase